jgi:hypothetical protein
VSHAVAALGAAGLTAAGCVWYLPALADLRAGADRPDSRRFAAAACVTGWAGTGTLAVLLLVTDGWWTPAAGAAAAGVATVALRLRAAVRHRRETREAARHWALLVPTAPPARPERSRHTVAAVLCCGTAAAMGVAVLHALFAPRTDGTPWPALLAAPAAVLVVFLVGAAAYARSSRRVAPDEEYGEG